MKTINNVYNIFKSITDNHFQIKSFIYGDISEPEKLDGILYPSLIVRPVSFDVLENTINHTYQISVAYLVNEDESNRTEVWSDSLSIIGDVIKILRYEGNDYNLINNPTLQPFYEKWSDNVSGVYGDFQIEFDFDNSECNVPISNFLQGGTTGDCPDVTIFSATGSVVTTVVAGGSYTLTTTPFYNISNSNDSYSINTNSNYELPDIIVNNIGNTFTQSYPSVQNIILPNIVVTNSNGTTQSFPSVKNVTCILSPKDTFLNFIFGIGATPDFTQTIVSGEEGVYTTQSLTNVTSTIYHKNGVTASLPITLTLTDTIRVIPIITDDLLEARVKIIGTY